MTITASTIPTDALASLADLSPVALRQALPHHSMAEQLTQAYEYEQQADGAFVQVGHLCAVHRDTGEISRVAQCGHTLTQDVESFPSRGLNAIADIVQEHGSRRCCPGCRTAGEVLAAGMQSERDRLVASVDMLSGLLGTLQALKSAGDV